MDVTFRPARDADVEFFHHLATETDPVWTRVCGLGVPLPGGFADRLWSGVHAIFTGVRADGSLVAEAAIYQADERDRTCWIEVNVVPTADRDDIERAATDQLLHRAFDRCGFRWAYLGHMVWQPPALAERWQAEEQARLPEYLLHEGSYWDYVVLGIARPS
jgi:hypothetical protein